VGGGYTEVSLDCVAEFGRPVYCGWRIEGSGERDVSNLFPSKLLGKSYARLTEETDKMIQEAERNCHSIEKRKEIDDMSYTMEMARMLKTEKLQKQEIIAFLVSG
jgi:hypothetical protein